MNISTEKEKLPFSRIAAEFWRRNQMVFVHLPLVLLALFGTYVVLKGIDSRIGIEGFGDLFGYLSNLVRGLLIVSFSWVIKKHCWFDLHGKTEEDLFKAAADGDRFAFALRVWDRIEWFAAFAFVTYWLTR